MGCGQSQARRDLESEELKRFYCVRISATFRRTHWRTPYREIFPGEVFPVMSFSHASAHSRTMSVAYLPSMLSKQIISHVD